MCFSISLIKEREHIEDRFGARFVGRGDFTPVYHVSAFSLPRWPVITMGDRGSIVEAVWGLIPSWTEDDEAAERIRRMTFNAKAETLTVKPSFRGALDGGRCIVPVDGFFEWHERGGRKFPHYVRRLDKEAFAVAGLYDVWVSPDEEKISTFTVITTDANRLLSEVHNTRKRMPALLPREKEVAWLDPDAPEKDALAMLRPYPRCDLEAYPVSRLIGGRGVDTNVPEAVEKKSYRELSSANERLF